MRVFLDCDGVLADFDAHYEQQTGIRPDTTQPEPKDFWKRIQGIPSFYRHFPKMADADELVAGVRSLGFEPTILTGIPLPSTMPTAADDKRAWAAEHFQGIEVICCFSRDKSSYAKSGDVLIDDRQKHRDIWEGMGGFWITHTSTNDSLLALRLLLVDLEKHGPVTRDRSARV